MRQARIGVTAAWRYIHEAVDLLAATPDDSGTATAILQAILVLRPVEANRYPRMYRLSECGWSTRSRRQRR